MGRRPLGAAVLTSAERSKRHREKRKATKQFVTDTDATEPQADHAAEIASLRAELADQQTACGRLMDEARAQVERERERSETLAAKVRDLEFVLAEEQRKREQVELEARSWIKAAEATAESFRQRAEFAEAAYTRLIEERQMHTGYGAE